MKRYFFASVLAVLFMAAHSQYFYNNQYYDSDLLIEAGAGFGAMNCFTDIGGRKGPGKKFLKDLTVQTTRPCVSTYLHLLYNYVWGIKLEYTRGSVTASDGLLKNDTEEGALRYKRNLHFRSVINEYNLVSEWHGLEQIHRSRQLPSPKISPYILLGIGFFTFRPEAKLNDQWISLQPLHTEGQGFAEYADRTEYKLQQFNASAGLGFKYDLSAKFIVRLELLHRLLFTDYLDDVSKDYIDPALFNKYLPADKANRAFQLSNRQTELDPSALYIANQRRGNSSNKDSYFSINLKLGIVLNRKRR